MTDPKPQLLWMCDSCTKQSTTDHEHPSTEHLDAPDGWVRLAVVTKDGARPNNFRWLCDECAGFIRRELPNALGLEGVAS